MARLCPECLGRGFVFSPGGFAPKLPCPTCEALADQAALRMAPQAEGDRSREEQDPSPKNDELRA